MFKAVCKLGLEGLFQRSSMRLIAVWAFEDLDQGEEPGSASHNSGY